MSVLAQDLNPIFRTESEEEERSWWDRCSCIEV